MRAEAFASFELLASRCLYKDAYPETMVVVDALAARNINLDMQSARRWQCSAAQAGGARPRRRGRCAGGCSANDPLVEPTLQTAYAGFDAWRRAREVRLPAV